ncbi:uncharacterized protein LOC108597026 [Drosophila busckii]|uniref:uncharacterized protein LOC108597026 n=1 Tax=Drosophila busckii TaxID=30019 RepID=UPI001432937B|nr:uncharacterized protein LOC108597026 [Drosophila busckii]
MPVRISLTFFNKVIFIIIVIILFFIWWTNYNLINEQNNDFLKAAVLLKVSVQNEPRSELNRLAESEADTTPTDNDVTTLDFQLGEDDFLEANPAKSVRYFVYNKKCKIPYADPFSHEALAVYTPAKLKLCTNESDLIELNYDRNTQHYKLHINENFVRKVKSLKCNYREITRGTKERGDFHSIIQSPVYFKQNQSLPRHISAIIVSCHDAFNASNMVQQDAFQLVQLHKKSKRLARNPLERRPSVILLGLDSISRVNFQRTMPKTAKFVSQPGWVEMVGYNKVADNTLPNLLAVLTGHRPHELHEHCDISSYGCLDELPWIWKQYKRSGYMTATGEDITRTSLFTLGLSGFIKVPTDYYLRPLLVAIEKALRTYRRFGYDYCIGRRLSFAYVYDFCAQFTSIFVQDLDQPVFGFFWSCTFTHDFYFAASSLDEKFNAYMQKFERQQLFEKAIVILFSDHGSRYGDLMDLSDSFLEERLPMLHIYLPPWFRKTYSTYTESLYTNHNRLCSNYDLHNTLRHFLQLNATTKAHLPPLKNCPSSQSLLHTLPEDRGCEDACIEEHWCTCNEFINHPHDGEIYYVGKLVVYHMNRWMLLHNYNRKCQRLALMNMDKAEVKVLREENEKQTLYGSIVTYRLCFRTFPEVGQFRSTVRYNRDIHEIENLNVPAISRLNSYHNNSLCINDRIAKKFCFCYPEWKKFDDYMRYWQNLKITTKANLEI